MLIRKTISSDGENGGEEKHISRHLTLHSNREIPAVFRHFWRGI